MQLEGSDNVDSNPAQLLSLLEVIVDNAERKESSPEKSVVSGTVPSAPEVPTLETAHTESVAMSPGVGVTSVKLDSEKPSTSAEKDENDAHSILANLPQAELRLLCSLLAKEGYC